MKNNKSQPTGQFRCCFFSYDDETNKIKDFGQWDATDSQLNK